MIEQLKLVRGAVAKRDVVPVLTHFHVYDGRLQGSNGKVSIDCGCAELANLNITVPAERFLKAVDACDGEPKIKITPAGKLSIRNKKFGALLPLEDNEHFPRDTPPKDITLGSFDTMLPALRLLAPFIADDATRMWSNGVWFHDGFAYATNNVVLARTPVSIPGSFILPAYAVDEVLRINMPPTGYSLSEVSLYLHYANGMWLRSQLIEGDFPGSVPDMIVPVPTTPIGKAFTDAVQTILPFCPESSYPRICLNEGKVATDDGAMSAEVAGFEGIGGYYRAEPMLAVAQVATGIDFSSYPKPCYFTGPNIEGILVGVRA